MVDKNNTILKQRNKQKELRKEIKSIKKRLPNYILGFIFFGFLIFYFFQNYIYSVLGNGTSTIKITAVIIGFICLIIFFKSYNLIQKKEQEIKTISSKLYKLMKLEAETTNE